MPYDLFLSFASTDHAVANEIYDRMTARGLNVFFSPKKLQGGDPWEEVIRLALLESSEVCVLMSPNSRVREWVLTEWGAVWALNRRITPILIDCEVNDLPERLRSKQCIKVTNVDVYIEELAARCEQSAAKAVAQDLTKLDSVRDRKTYRIAVNLLRKLSGMPYISATTGHNTLPGYLWSKHEPRWQEICKMIGSFSGMDGRFTPFTEPNQFTGEDEDAVKTSRKIIGWYLWGSTNCVDFGNIREKYDLPTANDVSDLS